MLHVISNVTRFKPQKPFILIKALTWRNSDSLFHLK